MSKLKKLYYKLYSILIRNIWQYLLEGKELLLQIFSGKTFANYLLQFSKEERLKPARKQCIERVALLLKKFEQREGVRICPGNFNKTHADNFIYFLSRKGYRQNTIFSYGNIIKTYIRVLDDLGIKVNKAFLHVKLLREEYAGVVLNEVEAIKVYRTPTKFLVTQIYFLIGCFTGLRGSDFKRITKEHIRNGIIVIRDLKTRKISRIPIHWIVKEIFEKYNYKLPAPTSSCSFNINIKKICRDAGLTENIIMEYFYKGKLVTKIGPKYKFISSHTARRSFISMINDAGISLFDSIVLTSHSSVEMHMGYVAGKSNQTATALKKHPFFSGQATGSKKE